MQQEVYNTNRKNINLKDFLEYLGYDVIPHGRGRHKLREHDSLIIQGSRFFWNSKNLNGNYFELLKALEGYDKEQIFDITQNFLDDIYEEKYIPSENIKAIDGIEFKEKSLPSEDYPGKIVLSYKGTDFDVRFYLGDFNAEERYQWELQYFTEEEKEHILNSKNALIVYMKFEGDAKKCYHLQLKLVYAMVPEMAALCDESAERMLNKKWVELAAKSNVRPSPSSLYTVQAVCGENEVWLHTHGLCRCNLHEIEILDSNKKDYESHYSLLSNYASIMIDGNYSNEDEEEIHLGMFYDGEPIVATSKKWMDALKYYPNVNIGGIEDRKESHNSKTNIIFLYESEEDYNNNIVSLPSKFTEKFDNNPLMFLSTEETARMSDLARERFSYVERMLKKKQEGNEDITIIVKLGGLCYN